jgi:hypothetical protein
MGHPSWNAEYRNYFSHIWHSGRMVSILQQLDADGDARHAATRRRFP